MTNEEALTTLESMDEFAHVCQGKDFEAIRYAIKLLQGRKPQGEWVRTHLVCAEGYNGEDIFEFKCSICGRTHRTTQNLIQVDFPFCNCGARMENEK